jgi:putative peptidoglycan lipid II flippase
MAASTLIVLASLPMYAALFHRFDVTGLAMASDVGILLHTVVIAWLLNRRGLVPLSGLPWSEVAKAFATAVIAGAAAYAVSLRIVAAGSWTHDLVSLVAIGLVWLVVVVAGLWFTRSKLWSDLRRRKPMEVAAESPAVVERTEGGAQP